MKDFESYAARERLASIRANTARKLTRQQQAQHQRHPFSLLHLLRSSFPPGVKIRSTPAKPCEQRLSGKAPGTETRHGGYEAPENALFSPDIRKKI